MGESGLAKVGEIVSNADEVWTPGGLALLAEHMRLMAEDPEYAASYGYISPRAGAYNRIAEMRAKSPIESRRETVAPPPRLPYADREVGEEG